jgi:hypothetical protein
VQDIDVWESLRKQRAQFGVSDVVKEESAGPMPREHDSGMAGRHGEREKHRPQLEGLLSFNSAEAGRCSLPSRTP